MIDDMRLNINKPVIMMSNLSFDHPLSYIELQELQNLLISQISFAQIYFKDNVDMKTIENVKLLLEGLPTVDDSLIEKYIMTDFAEDEKEKIINMNFINIDSWNIAYSRNENQYSITSLSKFRKIEEWFKTTLYEVESDKLSLLDKICIIYDKTKMLEYDTNNKYDRIPEIIEEKRATSYGYNLIFKELLSLQGIPSIVCKITNQKENNYITIALIYDENYKVDGIYCFDPSMDTIYKDQYKNNLARKINYNFFGLSVNQLNKIYHYENMQGILKILSSDDNDEFKHCTNLYESRHGKKEIEQMEKEFGMSLHDLFNKTINTTNIPEDKVISIITKSIEKYPDDVLNKDLFAKAIEDNYHARNHELFTNKYVKKMHKVDI